MGGVFKYWIKSHSIHLLFLSILVLYLYVKMKNGTESKPINDIHLLILKDIIKPTGTLFVLYKGKIFYAKYDETGKIYDCVHDGEYNYELPPEIDKTSSYTSPSNFTGCIKNLHRQIKEHPDGFEVEERKGKYVSDVDALTSSGPNDLLYSGNDELFDALSISDLKKTGLRERRPQETQ